MATDIAMVIVSNLAVNLLPNIIVRLGVRVLCLWTQALKLRAGLMSLSTLLD